MRTEIRSKGQEKKIRWGGKIETIRHGGRCCGERGGMINGGRIVEDYELIIKCKNNVTVCVCVCATISLMAVQSAVYIPS